MHHISTKLKNVLFTQWNLDTVSIFDMFGNCVAKLMLSSGLTFADLEMLDGLPSLS